MTSLNQNQINPWTQIWIHPRKTIRYLLDTNPTKVILWLAIISGMLAALSWLGLLWVQYPENERLQRALFVILILIIGGIIGIVHLYFAGWIFQVTGSWIGGKGKFIDVKCAVGWSNYPFIIASLISVISFLVSATPWIQGIFVLLNTIIVIWGFVIFLKLLGEAHRFSAWRALGAIFITAFLIFAVLMLISLLIPLLQPLFLGKNL